VSAIAFFRNAVEQGKSGDSSDSVMAILRNALGRALLSAGQSVEALTILQEAVGDTPDAGVVFANMADALRALKRPEEAGRAYRRALELDASVITCGKLALLYLEDMNDWRRCVETVDRGLEIDRTHAPLYVTFVLAIIKAPFLERTGLFSSERYLSHFRRARSYLDRSEELGMDPELATNMASIMDQMIHR
jgi:tetratricopeptide (TPR) repeat protein